MEIKNCIAFVDAEFKECSIKVQNGIFSEIAEPKTSENEFCGKYIIPGLVDIHTHGCLGYDFTFAKTENVNKMNRFYASHGVTSILATTMTESVKTLESSLEQITASDNSGTKILGVNLEGPFFKKEKKGAHNEKFLCAPDSEILKRLNSACKNGVKIVSVDPLYENAISFIEQNNRNYVISLGHTMCGYELAKKAFSAGANHVTHLFNAMQPFEHRAPGLVGAAFDLPFYSELICDMYHIHPSVVKMCFSANAEHTVLISDSIAPTGLPDGEYNSGGLPVVMKNGNAALKSGTIAGSTITLADALARCVKIGIDPKTAVKSATQIPAKSARIDDKCGFIKKGLCADFLVVDQDFNVEKVFIGGKEFH